MDPIQEFLAQKRFAVVGASADRAKYGNKVFRCYQQHGLHAVPVNPKDPIVEGSRAFSMLSKVPSKIDAVSIITPPKITESVIEEAGKLGIQHVWMQPGADSPAAVARAKELGMNVIAGGPCLLVALGFRE